MVVTTGTTVVGGDGGAGVVVVGAAMWSSTIWIFRRTWARAVAAAEGNTLNLTDEALDEAA